MLRNAATTSTFNFIVLENSISFIMFVRNYTLTNILLHLFVCFVSPLFPHSPFSSWHQTGNPQRRCIGNMVARGLPPAQNVSRHGDDATHHRHQSNHLNWTSLQMTCNLDILGGVGVSILEKDVADRVHDTPDTHNDRMV